MVNNVYMLGTLHIQTSDSALLSVKKSSTKIVHNTNNALTKVTMKQLQEYFDGQRTTFDIPVDMQGTTFQKAVWKALLKIPYGETRTYGQVAAMIGRPKAARAVGNALNKNPVCIIVPCHRVTASNGLGGYAYGEKMKKWLLSHEKNHIRINSDTGK